MSGYTGPPLQGSSDILSEKGLRRLLRTVPSRFCLEGQFELVYSITRDGVSLERFYEKANGCAASMLVLRDANHRVFGGFTDEQWKMQDLYYGSPESFVFTVEQPTAGGGSVGGDNDDARGLRTFQWSGKNRFFMHSTRQRLAMGGGYFTLACACTCACGRALICIMNAVVW